MAVPYTFGNATTSIPLSQLDTNFATAITIGNTAVYLGNTTTTFGNVTLNNVTINSGNSTVTKETVTTITSPAATALTIQSADTTAMTIDTSQNVGIGTSSPGSILDVQSATSIIRNTATTGTNQVAIRQGNTGGYFYTGIDTSTGGFLTGSAYAGFHWMSGAYPMIFATNNSERMRINSSGNVGIGETNPIAPLHISGNAPLTRYDISGAGTLSVGFNNSGSVSNNIPTGVSAVWMQQSYPLVFGTNGSERMRIDSSGRLLVGTTSAQGSSTGFNHFQFLYTDTNANRILGLQNSGSNNANVMVGFYNSSGGQAGSITQTGSTSVTYGSGSDYRLKKNVQKLPDAIMRVSKLNPVKFDWIGDDTEGEGFLAHELQEIVPYAVVGNKDDMTADGNPQYQTVDYGKITPLLVAAIQELKAELDALKGTK